MIFQRIRDVQRAAAEDGGGAAEEGGQHQEDLRLPSGGGYQGSLTIISRSQVTSHKSSNF